MSRYHGHINPQALHALEVAFGVKTHQSLLSEYFDYLGNVFRGRFGISLTFFPDPVMHDILQALPWTLVLVGVTTIVGFVLGTLIGLIGAWRRGGFLDGALPPIFIITSAFPYFWLAILSIWLFSAQARLAAAERRLRRDRHARLELAFRPRRVRPFDPAGAHDPRHRDRRLDPDDAQQHDLGADGGLRPHGPRERSPALADHVDVRRPQRDPAEPDRLRDVARLRRRRRDPRRVRLQLPGRRLDVPAVGREPGLRPDAGALPDDRRRGADRDPRRRRGDRAARSAHPGRADERLIGRSDRPRRDAAGRARADGRGDAARPVGRHLARDQPQPESGRRRRPDARLRRGLDLPGPDRALRPDGEGIPAGARRVLATPARHDGLRGGHLLSARMGNPGLARDRAGRRGARHGPRRPRRRLGGISRRSHRRVPLPRHRRDSRAADLPAHHRDRRVREERRLPHPRRGARSARLVVRRQAAPLADAVAAEARLPRVGARARRAEVVRHPVRDPADDDVAHRGDVPRGRALRGAHRGRPAVHRARRPEQPELGDDALLGAEQRGALRRHAAMGDRTGRLHRAARCVLRAPQLRVRRDQQPGAARAEARTGAVPQGRAAAA